MIFKKPYAFLIKNFRLIHLILTVLIGYMLVKTYNLYSFFSRYVSNVYATLSDAIPSNYVTVFMFLVAIIIITFALAMYLLMRKKEKPRRLYVALSVYYVGFLITLILYFSLFRSMEASQLSIRNAMIIRDLTLILAIPELILFVMSSIRAVGFDIKKFNFSKDLKDLDISEEDSEEFEFVLGVESYKYFRSLRRHLREYKYYILENKFMFTILASLALAVLLIVGILNFTVYNRTYGKNQKINANNLVLKVNNSYLTDYSYKGKKIEKGKYFLVANITFTNSSGLSTVLDLANYVLETKSGNVLPTLTRNEYFADFGAGYAKDRIENGEVVDYILVYELEKKDVAKKYTLRITDEVEYKAGTIHAKNKNISLKPLQYFSYDTVGTYEIGMEVPLYESLLQNSTLQVDSYEFKNKYTYKYEACIRTNCSEKTESVTADGTKGKTLLIINGDLVLDKESVFARNSKRSLSFFDAFTTLKYGENVSGVEDVTPAAIKDKYILEVDGDASKAGDIDLIVTVRNKRYILNLK